MAEITVATFKQGDRFSFTYNYGVGGQAATLIADVKPYGGGTILATLTVEEDETTAGKYYLSTDADTSDWGPWVMCDVYHTDTGMHDPDTLLFRIEEAVTDAREQA